MYQLTLIFSQQSVKIPLILLPWWVFLLQDEYFYFRTSASTSGRVYILKRVLQFSWFYHTHDKQVEYRDFVKSRALSRVPLFRPTDIKTGRYKDHLYLVPKLLIWLLLSDAMS